MADTVTLTSADNGRSLDVHAGDTIVITLAENPTTGYRWELAPSDGRVVKLVFDRFEMAPDPAVGSGGTHEFHVAAKAPGRAAIELGLRRSWTPDQPPLESFSVTVAVSP